MILLYWADTETYSVARFANTPENGSLPHYGKLIVMTTSKVPAYFFINTIYLEDAIKLGPARLAETYLTLEEAKRAAEILAKELGCRILTKEELNLI